MSNFQLYKKAISATGTTTENEPVIKSDAASSDVMEWQASTGSSKVEIREDASNNLKLEVDGIPVASGLAGIDAAGLHFDGAGYADCGDTTVMDGATQFSVEAIIQPETKQSGFTSGIVTIVGKSKGAYMFNLGLSPDYEVLMGVSSATATSSALEVGKVYHVLGTYDGATISIYVNGNLQGTTALAAYTLPNTTDHLSIGRGIATGAAYSAYGFVGTVYRARLWNKTLTAAEVTASFENSTVPFADQYGSQTSLVSAWTNNGGPDGYETLTSSGADISSGINSSAFGLVASAITLTAGSKYRIKHTFTLNSGTSPTIRVAVASDLSTTIFNELATSASEFDFTATTSGTWYIGYRVESGIATNFAVAGFSIVKTGAVADYDLAFSNPEISTMVQDRAGAADGTASSGVTQVTPIVQVNATAARIGTTAATPADGEIIAKTALIKVSDVSVTPNASADNLVVEEDGNAGISIISGTSSTGVFAFGDTTANMAAISYSHSTNDMSFRVNSTNDVLTLDSAGNVGIGVATPTFASGGGVHIDAGATTRLHLTSTATGSASGDGAELTIGTDSDFYVMNREAAKIRFYTNGTERLTIGSAGLATFANDISFDGATLKRGNGTASSNGFVTEYTKIATGLDDTVAISFTFPSQSSRWIHQILEINVAMGDDASYAATQTFLRYAIANLTSINGITLMDSNLGTGVTVDTAATTGTTFTVTLTEGSAVDMDSVCVFARVITGHTDGRCTGMTIA